MIRSVEIIPVCFYHKIADDYRRTKTSAIKPGAERLLFFFDKRHSISVQKVPSLDYLWLGKNMKFLINNIGWIYCYSVELKIILSV